MFENDGTNLAILLITAVGVFLPQLRYNEWGRAVLDFQKERLRTGQGREWFFAAYTTGDEKVCQQMKAEIAGNLVTVLSLIFCSGSPWEFGLKDFWAALGLVGQLARGRIKDTAPSALQRGHALFASFGDGRWKSCVCRLH